MSEYPEHIDQIDDFYRSQLADHEIEPPAGLWDKISLTAFNVQGPAEANASKTTSVVPNAPMFSTNRKIIAISIALLLIIIGSLYFYLTKENTAPSEKGSIPAIDQSIDEHRINTSTPENQNSEGNVVSPSSDKENKKTQQSDTHSNKNVESMSEQLNASEKQVEEAKVEVPIVTSAVTEEQKADSIADIKTIQKAPKEKVKFKDKYKKDYQDSTRKIFVPGK